MSKIWLGICWSRIWLNSEEQFCQVVSQCIWKVKVICFKLCANSWVEYSCLTSHFFLRVVTILLIIENEWMKIIAFFIRTTLQYQPWNPTINWDSYWKRLCNFAPITLPLWVQKLHLCWSGFCYHWGQHFSRVRMSWCQDKSYCHKLKFERIRNDLCSGANSKIVNSSRHCK